MTRRPRHAAGRATDREVGVVAAVLAAGSEKAAAHRLGLSHSTVKHHFANARAKTGATTTAQLVWILPGRLPEPQDPVRPDGSARCADVSIGGTTIRRCRSHEEQLMTTERAPVRRPGDDELVGFIQFDDASAEWQALTVFGGELARVATPGQARQLVLELGLASLAERWHWFSRRSGAWEVVLPQEARPGSVRVAVGYYALPGVPTALITADDLAAGDRLTLARPSEDEHFTPHR